MTETFILNPSDLKTYTAEQVASLVNVDNYAIRTEGYRRQDVAERKMTRLRNQLETAQREMADSQFIINASHDFERYDS